MDLWVVTIGEPLPGTGSRLWRSGAMAERSAREGHQVTWWTSDFDHFEKRHVSASVVDANAPAGVRVRLLHCRGYGDNISLSRIASHVELGRGFARAARAQARPDLILCSFPPAELALAVASYARRRSVPLFFDVRDRWPDVWTESTVQSVGKRLGMRAAAASYRALTRRAFRGATGFIGPTEGFVRWGAAIAGRPPAALDRVVPIGYPASDTLSEKEAEAFVHGLGIDTQVPLRIVFLGTLGSQFDFGPVLAAARAFRPDEARFVLAGSGSSLETLRRDAGGLPHVHLPGRVDGFGVRALLRWANVGLAPYNDTSHWRDNVANKPYEYMSGGLAVVSGVSGALASLLAAHRCGATYDPRRPETLVDILRGYLTAPETLAQTRDRASQAFEKHFSSDRTYGGLADDLARRAGVGDRVSTPFQSDLP